MKKNRDALIIFVFTAFLFAATIGGLLLIINVSQDLLYFAFGLTVVILSAFIVVFYTYKAKDYHNVIEVTQKPIVYNDNGVKLVVIDEERVDNPEDEKRDAKPKKENKKQEVVFKFVPKIPFKNKEVFDKVRSIIGILGGLFIICTGLMYVLLTDIQLANPSSWLFISMILSIGSGACFFGAAYIKHKKVSYLLLKGLAALLAMCFIGFLVIYIGKLPILTTKVANGQAIGRAISFGCIAGAAIASLLQIVTVWFDYTAFANNED